MLPRDGARKAPRRSCLGLILLAAAAAGCSADPTSDRSGQGNGGPIGSPIPMGGGTGSTGAGTGTGGSGFGNPAMTMAQAGTDRPVMGSRECASAMVTTSRAQPTILLVIDGSGSMCEQFGGGTRWSALRTALLEPMMGVIPRLQATVEFGLLLYDGTIDLIVALTNTGGSPNPACAGMYAAQKAMGNCPQLIEVPPALNNFAAIDPMFPQVELGGSTPTHKAMMRAVDSLIALRTMDPDAMNKPQYIILATDGQPNDICVGGVGGDVSVQQGQVLAEVDRAKMAGITTYVISLAGNDTGLQGHLDEVARRGDPMNPMARTFTPMTPQDLVNALLAIVGGAVGCEIFLNGMVREGAECSGFVELNGAELPCCEANGASYTCNGMATAMPDGWILKTPSSIELIGPSCDLFLQNPDAQLRAGFPCGVFVD
jgi:hypothetical protein